MRILCFYFTLHTHTHTFFVLKKSEWHVTKRRCLFNQAVSVDVTIYYMLIHSQNRVL